MLIQRIYKTVAQSLRSFTNKSEMDRHITAHRLAAGRKLHKNAKATLELLTRHSCVVTGISWLNIDTIARKINVCTRTAERALDRLEALGIGKRKVIEWNGMVLRFFVLHKFELSAKMSADLSVLESASELTAPKSKPALTPQEPKEPEKKIKRLKDSNKRKRGSFNIPDKLDESFVPGNVPKDFVAATAPFYRSAKEIYTLWGKVRIAAKGLILDYPLEQYTDVAVQAFKESVFARKQRKIKAGSNERAFQGYFYGTLYKMFNDVCKKEYMAVAKRF